MEKIQDRFPCLGNPMYWLQWLGNESRYSPALQENGKRVFYPRRHDQDHMYVALEAPYQNCQIKVQWLLNGFEVLAIAPTDEDWVRFKPQWEKLRAESVKAGWRRSEPAQKTLWIDIPSEHPKKRERKANVKTLRQQGLTIEEIAERVGVSDATVKRDLKVLRLAAK